jgi:hypothetical protein
MTELSIHSRAAERTQELNRVLLADAAVDVELVRRELGLTDVMSERLRRALDRLECVGGALEAMRSGAGGYESDEVLDSARRAVGELAARWPRDYPVGAVEWRLLRAAAPHDVASAFV